MISAHHFRQHSLERYWSKCPLGSAMDQVRMERFDPINGLFHSPTEYVYLPIKITQDSVPVEEELDRMLTEFVRGEFGSRQNAEPPPPPPIIEGEEHVSIKDLKTYLEICENELVYSGIASGIIKRSGGDMVDQITELLQSPLLGNPANKKFIGQLVKQELRDLIDAKKRLCILVPGFPFKDQNIFRTGCSANHVDLGEIALLIRLHLLTIAIYQVHPYGVDWLVATDGEAYASIFRVESEAVKAYHHQLLYLREQLNIFGSVAFVDLNDICYHLGKYPSGNDIFDSMKSAVENGLRKIVEKRSGEHEIFRVLVRGIKWNMNYKDIITDLDMSRDAAWTMLTLESPANLTQNETTMWRVFDQLAVESAIVYAAYNLSIRILGVFEKIFPSCVRGTTHPKVDQIAVPSLGISPWNGVALAEEGRLGSNTVHTEPLYKGAKAARLCPYYLVGASEPFFYGVERLP